MANILIVDDDPQIRTVLIDSLERFDHSIMVAEMLSEALGIISSGKFDLILLDVKLPDGSGLDALPDIRRAVSAPEVIIITGEGDSAGAKMAIEHEAWDYILKPFSLEKIILSVGRALEFRASKQIFNPTPDSVFDRSNIIGASPKLTACLYKVVQCSGNDADVLITGSTGTGKDLFANTIHQSSRQKKHNFIVVDCAALPEQLVESVLFGNVKGAYTGADTAREGLVKKADKGTLFLDEIGELPLSIQKKFLRVLQERKFKPVGGTEEITSNFRLISATNKDLDQMAEDNEFRSDLLFRIRTIHIQLPALKECREDIKPLALHYIHSLCSHHGLETKGFGPEFLDALESYDWPGNTRELIHSIEQAILANVDSSMIYPNFLPPHIRLHQIQSSLKSKRLPSIPAPDFNPSDTGATICLPRKLLDPIRPLKQVKTYVSGETEKLYLSRLMTISKGDMERAPALAGISKSRLYSLLKTHKTEVNE